MKQPKQEHREWAKNYLDMIDKGMTPQEFKPSKEEQERAMKEVAKYLSPNKVLKSEEHPDLEVRGEREIKPLIG